MIFLIEFPVFLLVLPSSFIKIGICLFAYLTGCFLVKKFALFERMQKFSLIKAAASAIISAYLGFSFYQRWANSSKVERISEFVHLSADVFLLIVAIVISMCAIYGIYCLIGIITNVCLRIAQKEVRVIPPFSTRNYIIILISCIVLYGLLLGGKYIWFDEAYSMAIIQHSFSEIWNITAADVHPPLYYFILKAIIQPLKYNVTAAKIVSIIPYVFILAFGGIQLKKLFNEKAAVIFMVLFFFYPLTLKYATEIRMYSWAAAFVFGNAIFAYKCFKENKKVNWFFLIIFSICSAYTHYYALIATGVIWLLIIIYTIGKKRRDCALKIIISGCSTIVLYLPWMKIFIEQLAYKVQNDYWIGPITIGTFVDYFTTVFGGGIRGILVFAAYLGVLICIIKSKNRKDICLSLFMLSIPLGTVLIGVAASFIVRPVFIIRYVVPSIVLIIVFMAFALGREINRGVRIYALAILLATGAIGYVSCLQSEYSSVDNPMDKKFVEQYSNADSFMVLTDSGHVPGVLCYYEKDKPVYNSNGFNSSNKACPFDNACPVDDFDDADNNEVVLLIDVNEKPKKKITDIYNCHFTGTVDECGNTADVYLLTKKVRRISK